MSVGHGMIWPLASEYAMRGWAVRRAGWSEEITDPFDHDTSLRWIVYHNGLFHLTYLMKSELAPGAIVSRVVRNTDFGAAEFLATDWTVYSPQCNTAYAGWDQQGKRQYPTPVDVPPISNPFSGSGTLPNDDCPTVPPIFPPGNPCEGPCPPPPNCGPNARLAIGGLDHCGCPVYLCQPVFCPDPPVCQGHETLTLLGVTEAGCGIWSCLPTCGPCQPPPVCGAGFRQVNLGVDACGCPVSKCVPIICGDPPDCPAGTFLVVTGVDAAGCFTYGCAANPPPPPPPPPPNPPPPPPPDDDGELPTEPRTAIIPPTFGMAEPEKAEPPGLPPLQPPRPPEPGAPYQTGR